MSSPQIAQGTLNRLRGSITFPNFPQLNITASFLGDEGIGLNPEGDIVDNLPTMTGTVTSPAPYQMITAEVELLKTQGLSNQFKNQLETLATLGPMVVRTDAATLGNYYVHNTSIYMASPGRMNGKSVGFMIGLRGFYQVNAQLFDTV